MNPIPLLSLLAGLVAAHVATPTRALPSDPAGIYARIDDARLLPNADHPDRIVLVGAFALADGGFGDSYRAPRCGRMVLTAPDGKLAECVTQWHDLVSVAGTDQIVAFSSRYQQRDVTVADAAATEVAPGVMYGDFGVRKISNANWGPVRELRLLCRPRAPLGTGPAPSAKIARGGPTIEFVVDNCTAKDADLRYVITVMRGDETFASPLLTPGADGTTRWQTRILLTPGETIRWSVQPTLPQGERMPVATAAFVVPPAKDD